MFILFSLVFCVLLTSCASRKIQREIIHVQDIKDLNPNRKYIKVHLKNGQLYVLHKWEVKPADKYILGEGRYLDKNRQVIEVRPRDKRKNHPATQFSSFQIPFEDIVIVETNDKGNSPGVATMVVLGIATTATALVCLVDPKSCFGSCPTFYVENEGELSLVGEGFSSSISPSLEGTDWDMIDVPVKLGQQARISVMNEALETHMIRNIHLIACKRTPGLDVLQNPKGEFYQVNSPIAPKNAVHNGQSIRQEIKEKDMLEWFSLSDATDLSKKEELYVEFDNSYGQSGLVLTKRQSLMTTFLFYQSLAFLGNANAYYLAKLENGDDWLRKRVYKIYDLLGGIEVAIWHDNQWNTLETINEAGPITSDTHLINLPSSNSPTIKVRLRMTKGLWRINRLNLTEVTEKVAPEKIAPIAINHKGESPDNSLTLLLDENSYLVSYPGDDYEILFPINWREDHQYFIESTGYYIEWIREEWLGEQDLRMVKKMLIRPKAYLRKMAPYYKIREPHMEDIFWQTRYQQNENQ
ncbi:hypothetical protein GCM10028791_35280 [Echinicola sediminis]